MELRDHNPLKNTMPRQPLKTLLAARKLATNSARHSKRRVHIDKEALRVSLNLLNIEVGPSISRRASGIDASLERPNHTADTAADTLSNHLRVRERDARRTGLALDSFVKVRGGHSWGLVLALEVVEGDVVADGVFIGVETELVEAFGAFEAAGVGVVGVDDLVWGGDDFVGGGEGKDVFGADCEGYK
jgi:hypothetical protein